MFRSAADGTAVVQHYDRINAFESGLVEDDTEILKFYVHVSKEEQLKRFKDRLDDPAKQ
jgi:polyphosphate kinase 2 (PPK2 family)